MPDSSLSGGDVTLVVVVLAIALAALGFAAYLVKAVLAADQGTTKMREIAQAVQEGAAAYLRRQFRTLGVFAVIVFILLLLLPVHDGGWGTRLGRAIFFLVGAAFSAAVGFIGMTLATRGNVRVAQAARAGGYRPAFRIAYRTGGVVGMITVGLGLFGAALVLLLFDETAPIVLEGFGFGGALLAMFMRVGGGIFTKAADVGADLVGKVEAGIPEDDPRNAATIADNVGDNVGDCAGMAADLFESYAVTLVAALILGQVFFGAVGMVFPLLIAAIGVIASLVGILASNPGKNDSSGLAPINRGFFTSAAVSLVLVAAAAFTYLPSVGEVDNLSVSPQVLGFVSVLVGVVLAAAIQQLTGYFTETSRKPVKDVGRSSLTGPATVILSGMSLGLESAVYAALLIGGFAGGAVARALPLVTALWLAAFLQMFSNLAFIWLGYQTPSPEALTVAIIVENFSGAIGTVIFVAYLSALCRNPLHTATQYALLTALASTGRTLFSSGTGFAAEELGWPLFFLGTSLTAIPALMLMVWLQGRGHFRALDADRNGG